ncbi:MAG: tetratricopeptide repeat protein [Candidatus Adiutrix sp.]|jgi:predicted negative regulator of RcsB-dependent stress response|nr:tetratricopeptide repeat protein [Candidatus Adiutrix sp.]
MAGKKPSDQKPIHDLLREKDAFLTTFEKIYEYSLRHTKGLLVWAALVALVIIGAALYRHYQQSEEEKAVAAYEEALEAGGEEARPGALIAALEEVRRQYAGRKAARLAEYDLLSLYSLEGDLDQAVPLGESLLQTLKPAEISLKPLLLNTLGGLYESKKDFVLAARSYEALLAIPRLEDDFKPDVLLSLGRAYGSAGQKDEAVKPYETLINQYPQSYQAYRANIKLAELTGRPVPFPLMTLPSALTSASADPVRPDQNQAAASSEPAAAEPAPELPAAAPATESGSQGEATAGSEASAAE